MRLILLKQGHVRLRKSSTADDDLVAAEQAASSAKVGVWSQDPGAASNRIVKFQVDEPAEDFLKKYKGKALNCIVDQVRDGSTFRVISVLPSNKNASPTYQTLTVFLSGIRAPSVNYAAGKDSAAKEPYALEAKFFSEVRLLNRSVQVILEGVAGNGNSFIGSIKHPAGNIAEALLSEGLARLAKSSITMVSGGTDAMQSLRKAEKSAQFANKRLWQSFKNSSSSLESQDAVEYSATVTKIQSGDCVYVVAKGKPSAEATKVYLSSVRQVKDSEYIRFEAREHLRQRLVGKTVTVHVDYNKPEQDGYEAKVGVTLTHNGQNVSVKLLELGYVQLIYHRRDDPYCSSSYDDLLLAEEKAKQEKNGVFKAEKLPVLRIIDASESAAKAKQLLPLYQKQSHISGVVDHVVNVSRYKLYLPKESAKLNLVLAGIRAIRAADFSDTELYNAALTFVQDKILQRDVTINIVQVDKTGAFVGSIASAVGHESLAAALVKRGYACVHHYSLSQLPNYVSKEILEAEKEATESGAGVYGLDTDEALKFLGKDPVRDSDPQESAIDDMPSAVNGKKVALEKAFVCEIKAEGKLSLQFASKLKADTLEKLGAFINSSQGAGKLAVKTDWAVNELCVAPFAEDKLYYRAKIVQLLPDNKVQVVFVDYGNSDVVAKTLLRLVPSDWTLERLPAQAQDVQLAFLEFPDSEYEPEIFDLISSKLSDAPQGAVYVQNFGASSSVAIYFGDGTLDFEKCLNVILVKAGLATVERNIYQRLEREQERIKRELVLHPDGKPTISGNQPGLKEALVAAQQYARFHRYNLWRFGDFQGEDTV